MSRNVPNDLAGMLLNDSKVYRFVAFESLVLFRNTLWISEKSARAGTTPVHPTILCDTILSLKNISKFCTESL